jgi:hypothetical protein
VVVVDAEREYPVEGADAYDALPDMAVVPESLAASPLASDPVYARGEAPGSATTPGESPGPEASRLGRLEARS